MGLTERHWFENEEPELTEQQLEDIVYENKRVYDRGYAKGYSARDNEIVRCKDCKYGGIDSASYPHFWCSAHTEYHKGEYFCADGERR